MSKFDVCIIGHITVDTIVDFDGSSHIVLGGVPIYAASIFVDAGFSVAVVTSASSQILSRAKDILPTSVRISSRLVSKSTEVLTHYDRHLVEGRSETITSRASTLTVEDVGDIEASLWMLGPLLEDDLSTDLLPVFSRRSTVAIDIQGLCRGLSGDKVIPKKSESLPLFISASKILKASRYEAEVATGASIAREAIARFQLMKVDEVVVTDGTNGSWVGVNSEIHCVQATVPSRIVDSTGCGDTYMAAYLSMRLRNLLPFDSGNAAAIAAAAKVSVRGAIKSLPNSIYFDRSQRSRRLFD